METLKTGPWIVRYDQEETARRYALAEKGGPDECGCEYCRNFVAARENVYPDEARRIFNILGIDCHKEAEVARTHRVRFGWHSYIGWLHFIGSIEYSDNEYEPSDEKFQVVKDVKLTDYFSWAFFKSSGDPPCLDVFQREGVSEIFFSPEVPWVLNTPEPT